MRPLQSVVPSLAARPSQTARGSSEKRLLTPHASFPSGRFDGPDVRYESQMSNPPSDLAATTSFMLSYSKRDRGCPVAGLITLRIGSLRLQLCSWKSKAPSIDVPPPSPSISHRMLGS